MALQDFFDSFDDDVELFDRFTLGWAAKGVGFGQFQFFKDDEGRLHIDNECCSKEFIKKILGIMVDTAILEDEPFTKQPQQEELNPHTHRIDGNHTCPHCGQLLTAATSVDDELRDVEPKPGDYSICINCTAFVQFTDEMGYHELTVDEICELPSEIFSILTSARQKIRKINKMLEKL